MLALVFTYVVPPIHAFRAPARDHRLPLPLLTVKGVDFPRLNPPKTPKAAAARPAASPFAVSQRPVSQPATTTRQARRVPTAAPAGKGRRVRVPVVSNTYATRPLPKQAAQAEHDPWQNAPVVVDSTGAIPAARPRFHSARGSHSARGAGGHPAGGGPARRRACDERPGCRRSRVDRACRAGAGRAIPLRRRRPSIPCGR